MVYLLVSSLHFALRRSKFHVPRSVEDGSPESENEPREVPSSKVERGAISA